MKQQKKLGELVLERGLITTTQLSHALAVQKNSPTKKRIGEVLIEQGMISEKDLLEILSTDLNMPIIDITKVNIDIKAVSIIPKQLATRYGLIGLYFEGSTLVIAVSDPFNFFAFEDIKSAVQVPQKFVLSLSFQILGAIDKNYSELDVKRAATKINASVQVDETLDTSLRNIEADDETPVVNLINSILLKGKNIGASDIHIEPFEILTSVRLRIDGQLLNYLQVSNKIHSSLVSRIKIMSELDIAEKRLPQDGHFKTKIEGQEMNVRVSTLPMLYGEKIVMRFLNTDGIRGMETYGMNMENYTKIERILKNPNGVIYITGPTGSGKTTTLYAMIERIAAANVNVSTIEDPVERPLERVNQTQVNTQAGLTFAAGLRSLLRQDPDVIMVGETRDSETAQIGITAAITGHLVVSTLHTNDACSTITRIEDMGVEPFMVAASLKGIVAQRLMKRICPDCKVAYATSESERKLMGRPDLLEAYHGEGCEFCNNTGYKGRIAVHEILEIDEDIRRSISKGLSTEELIDYVIKHNKLKTLKMCAIELIENGVTTVEEMTKVAYTI